MPGIADLLRPAPLENDEATPAGPMVAQITDLDPLRVTVPTIDGGRDALRVFGTPPDAALPGDEVRVGRDEYGGLVLVAWEPA